MTDSRASGTLLTSGPNPVRWHRPLLWVAATMVALATLALIARFVDARVVTGLDSWDKPLKFALSTFIYAVTWSWLIGQLQRRRRLAVAAGTVIAVMLAVELAVITVAAAAGTTSHFNVSDAVHTTAWSIMAASISILWVATFVVVVLLFLNGLGDRARTLAIRAGAVITIVGLGLGFLMTGPTAAQLADFQGIAGAHTVGLADGGPGLPILGWSTIAGDLRIPHFVGMHALQAIPIALIAMELLSQRIVLLRSVTFRARLVWVAAIGYAGFVAIVTWQALRGQSIVQSDAATLVAGAMLSAGLLVGVAVVIAAATRDQRRALFAVPVDADPASMPSRG